MVQWYGPVVWYSGMVQWYGTVVWCSGMVQWYGTAVWYSCIVQWYGTVVWYSGIVQWYGTVVWYSGMVQWYGTVVWYNDTVVWYSSTKKWYVFINQLLFSTMKKRTCLSKFITKLEGRSANTCAHIWSASRLSRSDMSEIFIIFKKCYFSCID